MPNGGILRQALRLGIKFFAHFLFKNKILVSTMAVRNILACRVALKERGFSESTVKQRASSQAAEDVPSSLYRTPEFVWSRVHIRLLNDLLLSIENIAEEWNE